MMRGPEFFASCASPVDLLRAVGADVGSPAIETILDAAYAATPTTEERRLWRELSPMPWPTRRARRIAECIGRRGLKTTSLVAPTCVYETLCVPHDEHALPGSRIYAIVVAPKIEQARESIRAIRACLDSLAPLGVTHEVRDAAGAPEIVVTRPRGRCERVIRVVTADALSVRSLAVYFAAFDEAGFLPSEDWLAVRDVDIVRAVQPAMIQFPERTMLFASSPGRPGSYFHGLVEKPGPDVLVVRAPTWVTNPRITEDDCLKDAGGDLEVFEREYAARKFGAAGESFISSAAVWRCLGSKHAGLGPERGGFYCIGLDVAQLRDQTAIVVASSFEVEIDPAVAPVRHVRVEHAEAIASSKRDPTPIEMIAGRVVELSKMFNDAPVIFDPYQGPSVMGALAKLGMRAHDNPNTMPTRGTFAQRSMAPQHQTPRWRSLRSLIEGRRLHLSVNDEPLAKQLSELKATQLSSGALKIEGRRDDLADALALATEMALQLPATGGPDGHVEHRADGAFWTEAGVQIRNSRWVRIVDGKEVPAEMPEWAPDFEDHVGELLRQGIRTPKINAWLARQPDAVLERLGLITHYANEPITHVRVIGG